MHFKTINFKSYSSLKIGNTLEVAILDDCNDPYQEYHLIGSCNNSLIGSNPPKLMMLDKKFNYIKIEDNYLKIGGATPSGKIASFCKKHNIGGFEFLSHLPGKLGGLVFMNAGLKEYEIFDNLIEITTCSHIKPKCEINFSYRFTDITEPILEASFKIKYGFDATKVTLFKKMRLNQPSTPSAGSCFKNPVGEYAGKLIEDVGLKGFRVGSMEFSTHHANFLVNHGDGKFEDAIYLINEAKKRVLTQFNIRLECEINILNKNYI